MLPPAPRPGPDPARLAGAGLAAPPRVAVVVPIFRHSVLVGEAIESVLEQRADFAIRLLLVNDGCPHPETDAICRDYARAYPGRISYLCKPNGGLSDARNHGIRHVLDRLPSVEAVYLLDADNRLRPPALARAMAALEADPGAGWIYPDIDMFGSGPQVDFGGAYSLLVHSVMNICEAGSLVRRAVFEAGVMFDTGFRMGFEDWDFFLSAAEAGFRGRHLEDFGFLYRKRPESMLAESHRDAAEIRGTLRGKHPALFSPRGALALEQREAPRYAIYLADRDEMLLTVDPAAAAVQRLSPAAFEELYWRARLAPSRHHAPPFVVMASSATLALLERAQCLHWVFWKIEQMVEETGLAALRLGSDPEGRFGFSEGPARDGNQAGACLMAIGAGLIEQVLGDASLGWINSVIDEACQPPVSVLELALPPQLDLAGLTDTAAFDLLVLLRRLHNASRAGCGSRPLGWRAPGISWRREAHRIVRRSLGGAVVYPRLAPGGRQIGFVLPLVEFGGVEKVALNMAAALRGLGWVPHLFVLGRQDGAITAEWTDVFASVNFLSDPEFGAWGRGEDSYFGTEIPPWAAASGRHGRALGLMFWLDAVVNMHGGAFAGVAGQLRRLGVTTVTSLHLNDLSPARRPVGNTYLGLAYEHAFDLFAPCSARLADWCHGLGVPADKIVPVPNAPSFPVAPGRLARDRAARAVRDPNQPLRVLYLGRLDRQKGLHRLERVVAATAAEGPALHWRVIGKPVLEDAGAPLSETLQRHLEPPLTSPEALSDAFAWADVLVLLSSFEGLPLILLEAMRAGVVPLATDVGAVSEVLRDGETGLLLPLEGAAEACRAGLAALDRDRALLRRLAGRAAAAMEGRDWTAAVRPLHLELERKCDARAR